MSPIESPPGREYNSQMIQRIVSIFAVVTIMGTVSFARDDENESLMILRKPLPAGAAQCEVRSAVVRLRVTFHESGKITEAAITLPSGCEFFDREALKAARKIKFRPARKNGKGITVTKNVDYSFTRL